MVELIFRPDREYDVGSTNVRFAVPSALLSLAVTEAQIHEVVKVASRESIKKATEDLQKRDGWNVFEKAGHEFHLSEMQMDEFEQEEGVLNTMQRKEFIYFYCTIFFTRPVGWVETDQIAEEQQMQKDGFVDRDRMPAGSLPPENPAERMRRIKSDRKNRVRSSEGSSGGDPGNTNAGGGEGGESVGLRPESARILER